MRIIFYILILTVGVATVLCAAPQADVMVRPSSEVDGQQVTIGDIAVVNCKDAKFAEKLCAVHVCPSPIAGHNRILTRDQVLIALRRGGILDASVNLLSPAKAIVTRAATTVPGQAIFDAVRDYVMANKTWEGTAEVEAVRLPSDQILPSGTPELRVRDNGQKPRKGRCGIPVEIVVAGRVYSTVYVSVNVRVFALVIVATQAIPRGTEITAANTSTETREITFVSEDSLNRMPESGALAAQAIASGTVIRRKWITEPAAIHSGDKVVVVAKGENVSIADKGIAAADGKAGDIIKVRLNGESRVVRGRVAGPGLVEIQLNGRS